MFSEFSAFLSILILLVASFHAAGRNLRDKYRFAVGKFLKGQMTPGSEWELGFIGLFDKLFRTHQFQIPIPSFIVSCLVSSFTVVVCYTIYIGWLLPDTISVELRPDSIREGLILPWDYVLVDQGRVVIRQNLEVVVLLPLVMNLIPDFLSMIETRVVLSRVHASRNVLSKTSWIIGDAIFTLLLAFIAYTLMNSLYFNLTLDHARGFIVDLEVFAGFFLPTMTEVFDQPLDNEDAAYIYSTFFTSAWIWLYLAGAIALRIILSLPSVLGFLNKYFKIEQHIDRNPVAVIGNALIVVFIVFYTLIVFF